jgi:site-specific recombinase
LNGIGRDGYPPKIKFLEIILATAKKTAFLTRVQAGFQHRISSFLLFFILHPFICPQPPTTNPNH